MEETWEEGGPEKTGIKPLGQVEEENPQEQRRRPKGQEG